MSNKLIEMKLIWGAETDKAYGVMEERHAAKMYWLPKSQVDIEEGAELNYVCEFLIPEWLAIEKGLV